MQQGIIWKMLKQAGYQASVYQCSNCGQKLITGNRYWFLPQSGVICEKCQSQGGGNKLAISEEGIKILRVLLQRDLAFIYKLKISAEARNNITILTKSLLENMLQRRVGL